MSRRSGDLSAVARSAEVEAAEEDNHSDISPTLESTTYMDSRATSLGIVSDLSMWPNHLRRPHHLLNPDGPRARDAQDSRTLPLGIHNSLEWKHEDDD